MFAYKLIFPNLVNFMESFYGNVVRNCKSEKQEEFKICIDNTVLLIQYSVVSRHKIDIFILF